MTLQRTRYPVTIILFLITFLCGTFALPKDDANDDVLIDNFIHSRGGSSIIFDASNIKQYWIDKSVAIKDKRIFISMADDTQTASVPLKIQLANVNESFDCKVDVFSEDEACSFSVLDPYLKTISSSTPDEQFVKYYIASSTFHLENCPGFSFNLKFSSKPGENISIKKIALSFSQNKNSIFLSSPGVLNISTENASISPTFKQEDNNSFSVTGKSNSIFSKNKILISDNTLKTSVSIKNIGSTPVRIYFGYAAYDKNSVWLNGRNYPYRNLNQMLKIISVDKEKGCIIVDSCPKWEKDCFIAYNVSEDLSDIPSNSLLAGKITNVIKRDDSHYEIVLDKPFDSEIKTGSFIRIHGLTGAYFYTDVKVLQPGEEASFASTLKKDNDFLQYAPSAFSKDIYYVIPLILFNSVDQKETNTIRIQDFKISF